MAYGVKALSKIQLGVETTAGTAATATAVWRGEGTFINDSPIEFVPEDVGALQDKGRTYMPRVGAVIELDETPATFEQFPYLLVMGVDGDLAGVQDTSGGSAGSGYVYTATLANATQETPAYYTVEAGDNSEEYECYYTFCEEFTLSGAKNEAVMMSGRLRGRQATTGNEYASISPAVVEEVLFNEGKLYIDATTLGSTQKTGTFLGFTLNVPTGFKPVYTGDGELYFSAVKQTDLRDITGELVLENDATGVAEVAAAAAETTRLVRIVFDGSALTTAAAYTYKTLKIDLALRYTAVPSLEDQEGDNIVRLPFKAIYNASGGIFTVVNNLSALT